ncbi:MAG: hypothetical protein IMZ53_00515 [Thermoplasmata archaeon]|nr:hypothetical protein [Thermoplasmata archaeon]
MADQELKITVKVVNQSELNALWAKMQSGNATINEQKQFIKLATKAWGDLTPVQQAANKEFANSIVLAKELKSQGLEPLTTANGKMMKSYFSTGEELRRFYREQRVGDRTMRESTQAISGFGSMLGGDGLGKIVGSVTSRFQEMEFSMTGMGIAAQSSGGKLGSLGKTLMGLATPLAIAAAAIGAMYVVGEKVAAVYERLNKALIELGKQSFAGASKQTQVDMLNKQINKLSSEKNESPSIWSALGGGSAMRAEQLAQSFERQKTLNDLIKQRDDLENDLAKTRLDNYNKLLDEQGAKEEEFTTQQLDNIKKKEEAEKKYYKEKLDAYDKALGEQGDKEEANTKAELDNIKKKEEAEKKYADSMSKRHIKAGKERDALFNASAKGRWKKFTHDLQGEFETTNIVIAATNDAVSGLQNSMSTAFSGMLQGTMNIGQGFTAMKNMVIQALSEIIAKMMAMFILQQIFGFAGIAVGAASSGGASVLGSAGGGGVPMASMAGGGSSTTLQRMSVASQSSRGGGGMKFPPVQVIPIVEADKISVMVKYGNQMRKGRVG